MSILVTGSKGQLGKKIISVFKSAGLDVIEYSHSMPLENINWAKVRTVVNCAATTPSPYILDEMYIEGNVRFIEKMLPYLIGKDFIHFSTFSELYRDSAYQRSKMLGTSILLTNAGCFSQLTVIPLPTLDDIPLIQKICQSAINGEMPIVDSLKYNAMTYDGVAEYVKQLITGETKDHITKNYRVKNLYSEVIASVSSNKVRRGSNIDRTLNVNGIYISSHDL